MRPKLTLLDTSLVDQIIDEAFGLLIDPGVRVHNEDRKNSGGSGSPGDGFCSE